VSGGVVETIRNSPSGSGSLVITLAVGDAETQDRNQDDSDNARDYQDLDEREDARDGPENRGRPQDARHYDREVDPPRSRVILGEQSHQLVASLRRDDRPAGPVGLHHLLA